jgi:hypothetical protein
MIGGRTTNMTDAAQVVGSRPARPPLDVDPEARELMASPVFRAMLEEAKQTRPDDLVSLDELDERLGPMTQAETARADSYLTALDRLEEEQGGEVADGQGRLIRLVLMAAEYVRGHGTLGQLSKDGGFAEAEIRAAAAALRVVGLDAGQPAERAAERAPDAAAAR